MVRPVGVVVVSVLFWCATAAWAARAAYDVTDLGPLVPHGISPSGEVIGDMAVSGGPQRQAVLRHQDGTLVLLGNLQGDGSSFGVDANTSQVVGYSNSPTTVHGFVWTAAGGLQPLPTLGGYMQPVGINGAGTIAASANTPAYTTHPVVLVGGQLTDLGTLGGPSGYAKALTESGDVVGASMTATGAMHASLWPVTGGVVDLGTLGSQRSTALAVNDQLHIVGHRQSTLGILSPWIWTQATGMQDLPKYPGDQDNMAVGISLDGTVFGDGEGHTFVWRPGQAPVDLEEQINATGWDFYAVVAVNAQGAAVGLGTHNGVTSGFLLTPTGHPVEDTGRVARKKNTPQARKVKAVTKQCRDKLLGCREDIIAALKSGH